MSSFLEKVFLLLLCLCASSQLQQVQAAPRGSLSVKHLRSSRELLLDPELPPLDSFNKKKSNVDVPERGFTAQDEKNEGDKKNKKNKSAAPSSAPTVSAAPTVSVAPSAAPSVVPSAAPSVTPSAAPSPEPTAPPSAAPSPQPSLPPTPAPTTSSQPTVNPTLAPTHLPTTMPPTTEPTQAPTQPVPITTHQRDSAGDIIIMDTVCTGGLPETASEVTEQDVTYNYKLYMQIGVDPYIAAAFIERKLQRNMTAAFLDCSYQDELNFRGLSSEPVDRVLDPCGIDQDTICYQVEGGLTASLFYMVQQRQRRAAENSEISDMRIVQKLGPYMDDLFSNGWLSGPYEEIVGMDFEGFTNVYAGVETFGGADEDEDDGGAAGLQRGSVTTLDDGSKVPIAIASVAVAIAALALLAVLCFASRRQRKQRDAAKQSSDKNKSMETASPEYDRYTYEEDQDQEEPSVGSKKYPLVEYDEDVNSSMYSHEDISHYTGNRSYEVDDTVDL